MSEFNQPKLKKHYVETDRNTSFVSLLYKINILRCFIKWIINLVTGTCELQRILKNYNGATQTLKLGKHSILNFTFLTILFNTLKNDCFAKKRLVFRLTLI